MAMMGVVTPFETQRPTLILLILADKVRTYGLIP